MRSFSLSEKAFIKRLVNANDIDSRALNYYLYDESRFFALEWDDSSVTLFFTKEGKENKLLAWDELCEKLFLLKYLEDNALIGVYNYVSFEERKKCRFMYNKNKYKQISDYYRIKEGNEWILYEEQSKSIFYSDIGMLLDKYANSIFYVSEGLKELVKHKFLTLEEKRHRETLIVSCFAIFISFIIGLFG